MTSRRGALAAAGALGVLAACGPGEGAAPPGPPARTPPAAPVPAPPPRTPSTSAPLPLRHGAAERQVADLWLPDGERRDVLVVLLHGGWWGPHLDRTNTLPLVADLVGDGYPVLNADYRGTGQGGGWPGTFADVAASVDSAVGAARTAGVPAGRTALVGHSAGGHLAAWAATRHRLPPGAPGAGPVLRPALVVSVAGVLHPTALGRRDRDGAAVALFGGTAQEVDDRYALGDPTRLVPSGVRTHVVHSRTDEVVPVAQAQQYAAAATAAGDDVVLRLLESGAHADALDPAGAVWAGVRTVLGAELG